MTGTFALVRLLLRRDRLKLTLWVVGIAVMFMYVSTAIPAVYPTEDDLTSIVSTLADPIGRMLVGPGYGFAQPTYETVIANGYGLWIMVLAALMNIFLVVRHTRTEEASGRAELVRADVVGRHAPLTAALVLAVAANAAVMALAVVILVGSAGYSVGGSILLAASVAAVGLAFAGITSVTVQLSSYPRAASGMAGAVLGAAFVIRGAGDMVREGGSALSWVSPLGWGQQTGPFVLDRWWPLVPLVALAGVTVVVAFVLSSRRDLGASFLAVRPGSARGAAWLGTPMGLAFRLQRANTIGWAVALIVTAGIYGSYAKTMGDNGADLPDVFDDLFGEGDLIAGYLAYIATFSAYLMGLFVVGALRGVWTDETAGRGEPVLAAPVSRTTWLVSNAVVVAVAVSVMSVLAGLAGGGTAAATTGRLAYVGEVLAAQLNQIPAVLVVLAVAVACVGAVPRAIAVGWVVVGFGLFVGTFGPILGAPQLVLDLSPFEHVADIPLESFAALPVAVLTAVALALAAVGVVGYRRRDIQSV